MTLPVDPPPGLEQYGLWGVLVGALLVACRTLWQWGRDQTDARISDHKDHSKDLMTGIKALDEARKAVEARHGDQ